MANFSLAGFNIGTDVSITVLDNYGDVFPLDSLGLLMELDSESLDKELDVVPISDGGVPLFMTIPAGWRGRMMFTRTNGNFQQMFTEIFNAYFANGVIPIFSLQGSILNRDGSIDEFLFSGVQFSKPRLGNFRAEKEVDMQMEFRASTLSGTGVIVPFLPLLAAA